MLMIGVEPKSLRKMKDMDVVRGGDVLEKKAKEVRGKWTPFNARFVAAAGTDGKGYFGRLYAVVCTPRRGDVQRICQPKLVDSRR